MSPVPSGHIKCLLLSCLLAGGLGFACEAADYSLLPPMNGLPSDFAERRAGKEVNASIRIGVTEEGIYRVTYSNLTGAGVAATNLVGSMMRLFCRTQEIAILVSSTNQWTAEDYFLFPGVGFDGYYNSSNVYWLGFGSGGKRMGSRSASPFPGIQPVVAYRKAVLHRDFLWKDNYRPDDESFDHWIDPKGVYDSSETTFSLPLDQLITNDSGSLSATLYGWTSFDSITPDHCTQIRINSNVVAKFTFDGQTTLSVSTNIGAGLLAPATTIGFREILQPGCSNDTAFLGWFSINYSRRLLLETNVLLFAGLVGTNNYQVGGFSGATNVFAFDVSDPANAAVLSDLIVTNVGGGSNAIVFGEAAAVTSRFAVCQSSGIRTIASVQRVFFRGLASASREADYVVICPYEFRQQVYRLLALRHAQGLSVAVAPLPDIYNEFGYGICDAVAIKQFLGYAHHHWRTPPAYVLLVGSGTYNPRMVSEGYSIPATIIPVHLGAGFGLWTALDGWYANVNGVDAVTGITPNYAIGRIPVETEAQLKSVIDKIVEFEGVPKNDPLRGYALLVADKNDDANLDFKVPSQAVRDSVLIPNGMIVSEAYSGVSSTFPRRTMTNSLNSGTFLVNYFGHGFIDYWGNATDVRMATNDVASLVNSFFPVVSTLTCENGAFHSTKYRCLARWFLEANNHGAAACVASSDLASLDGGQVFAEGFFQAILSDGRKRIGDAMAQAYGRLYEAKGNTRELWSFELFGDPAMIVNP